MFFLQEFRWRGHGCPGHTPYVKTKDGRGTVEDQRVLNIAHLVCSTHQAWWFNGRLYQWGYTGL